VAERDGGASGIKWQRVWSSTRLNKIIFETMQFSLPSWDPDILGFSDQVFGDQKL
jgi:hypothetical protein